MKTRYAAELEVQIERRLYNLFSDDLYDHQCDQVMWPVLNQLIDFFDDSIYQQFNGQLRFHTRQQLRARQ